MDLLGVAIAQGFYSQDQNWTHLERSLETLRGYPPVDELIKPQ